MIIGVTSQNFRTFTGYAGKACGFFIYQAEKGQEPEELERLDLPKEMSIHESVAATHPVDIWVGNRWAYLAIVMDLLSRKRIGWALSNSLDNTVTGKALSIAFEVRGKPKGVMYHSDQGCHYTIR